MSVEIGLASMSTADLAIKCGKELVERYSAFKDAGLDIQEKVVIVESSWMKAQCQIDFLNRIWETLDIAHQEQYIQTFGILVSKLQAAIEQISRVQSRTQGTEDGQLQLRKRLQYALIKESIGKAIQELEDWRKVFDPSWFLILKMASPLIDRELDKNEGEQLMDSIATARGVRASLKSKPDAKTSLFLSEHSLATATITTISHCTAQMIKRSSSSGRCYIIDTVECLPGIDRMLLREDVRNLAGKLSAVDPITFGLLQCKGVLDRCKLTGFKFDFVFYVPPELKNPRSLRTVLLAADPNVSLSSRFRIAQQLAQSVSFVHTCNFVHKSIRSDTILVFAKGDDTLAASFLLGFQRFRTAVLASARAGDYHWKENLYRHPRRQGLEPEDTYTMQHDIYSLGVCLLEIGLWESFVVFESDQRTAALPTILEGVVRTNRENSLLDPASCKRNLVELARQKLPSRMGDKYTDVVINCLTCLDEENMDFGDQSEFEDEDGILVGVRFIEKILLQLNNISI